MLQDHLLPLSRAARFRKVLIKLMMRGEALSIYTHPFPRLVEKCLIHVQSIIDAQIALGRSKEALVLRLECTIALGILSIFHTNSRNCETSVLDEVISIFNRKRIFLDLRSRRTLRDFDVFYIVKSVLLSFLYSYNTYNTYSFLAHMKENE